MPVDSEVRKALKQKIKNKQRDRGSVHAKAFRELKQDKYNKKQQEDSSELTAELVSGEEEKSKKR